jgi:uncharacterized protein DUF4831
MIFLSFNNLQSFSQITVTKVDNKNVTSTNPGFFYSLPQTVFRIDIVYEKIQHLEGPLSAYTQEYLGVTGYIKDNRTSYEIVNVNVSSFQEADAKQYYFVQFASERLKDAKSNTFTLSEIGGLLAFNSDIESTSQKTELPIDQTFIFDKGDDSFPYMSQYNKRKETDTIIRRINIDTVVIDRFIFNTSWVDKSMEDKAKDAAMRIGKIRENRYNLITGYQEVNYGASIIYMDQQLTKMENQYLELFLGKRIKTVKNETVYFIPGKNKLNNDILKFKDGRTVIIRVTPDDIANNISESSGTSLNSVFYRIPANANVNITSGNVSYYEGRFIVNQLGIVASAPLVNTKLQFDSESGNILKLERD